MSFIGPEIEQTIGETLRLAVDRFRNEDAYTFADRRIGFHEADADSNVVARALLASGIRRGGCVAGVDG
jgi:hypothetical protein